MNIIELIIIIGVIITDTATDLIVAKMSTAFEETNDQVGFVD